MDIRSILARGPATPSAIAAETGVTVSNVVQRLKGMESRDEVSYTRERTGGKGRPAKLYRLADHVELHGAIDGIPIDVSIAPTPWERAVLNLMRIPQSMFREYLMKWLCLLETRSPDKSTGLAGIERLYVFGSVARGTADRDSDIDVLVVTDGRTDDDLLNEYTLVPGREDYVTVSPLVYSSRELRMNLNKAGNLMDILKEAILIWQRTDGAPKRKPISGKRSEPSP